MDSAIPREGGQCMVANNKERGEQLWEVRRHLYWEVLEYWMSTIGERQSRIWKI